MIFTRSDWDRLAQLFYGVGTARGAVPYAGYKPAVREAPNGDTKVCICASGIGGDSGPSPSCSACRGSGRVPNTDAGPAGKRYLHVAEKYLAQHPGLDWPREYLARAYYEICRVADALQLPDAYYPRPEDTTLRVLEYPSAGHEFPPLTSLASVTCLHCDVRSADPNPARFGVCPALAPGAGTAEHTDFDLFTIVCWRETPEDLERHGPALPPGSSALQGRLIRAEGISPGLHIGEIGELVGLGPATPHRVPARPYVQRSIVAFAMPRLDAWLPRPVPAPGYAAARPRTVREWLAERMARSRYT